METTAILNYQKIWQSVVNNRISMYHRIDPLAVSIKHNSIKHSMPIVVCIRRRCVGTRQSMEMMFRIALNRLNSMFFFTESGESSSDDENLSDNNNAASASSKLNGNDTSNGNTKSNQNERNDSSASNFPIPSTSTGITGNGNFCFGFRLIYLTDCWTFSLISFCVCSSCCRSQFSHRSNARFR